MLVPAPQKFTIKNAGYPIITAVLIFILLRMITNSMQFSAEKRWQVFLA
jgi:hypothetical protein